MAQRPSQQVMWCLQAMCIQETQCFVSITKLLLLHQTSDSSRAPQAPANPGVSTPSAADQDGAASERPGAAHASLGDAACCAHHSAALRQPGRSSCSGTFSGTCWLIICPSWTARSSVLHFLVAAKKTIWCFAIDVLSVSALDYGSERNIGDNEICGKTAAPDCTENG